MMWSFFSRDPLRDFPYDFDKNSFAQAGIWKLHNGVQRSTGEEVTVFVLADENRVEVAHLNLKKLRGLRHPNILKYFDSAESDKCVYIATERVTPLSDELKTLHSLSSKKRDLAIRWGLHQLLCGLSFVETSGKGHWNVRQASIFVTKSGEWKLGGFEVAPDPADTGSGTAPLLKLPDFRLSQEPPEMSLNSSMQNYGTTWSYDAWSVSLLMKEVYPGGRIPKQLASVQAAMGADDPRKRPSPASVLERGKAVGGFFDDPLVRTLIDLENVQASSKDDAQALFSKLQKQIDDFPENISRFKILPLLMNAHEFGSAGVGALSTIFSYAKLLDANEYTSLVLPFVIRLFASKDRVVRLRLLQNMDQFAPHLNAAAVNAQIFPNLVLGFQDTNPTIREHTLRALLTLAPKLNHANLNVEVLKHLARIQSRDEEGGIRTNTTICLGKMAQYLSPDTRQKVLIAAFCRALKDPFPPARSAGILALSACQGYFYLKDVACRVVPCLAPLTVDPEKSVRDEAFKAINGFVQKLEKVSADPSVKESLEADVNAAVGKDASAASSWAGWAMSALSNNLVKQIGSRRKAKQQAQQESPERASPVSSKGDESSVKADEDEASDEAKKRQEEEEDVADVEADEDDGGGWEGIDEEPSGGHSWGWDNEWSGSQGSKSAGPAGAANLNAGDFDKDEFFAAIMPTPAEKLKEASKRASARKTAAPTRTEAANDSWGSWDDGEGDGDWKDFENPKPKSAPKKTHQSGSQQRFGARLGAKKISD